MVLRDQLVPPLSEAWQCVTGRIRDDTASLDIPSLRLLQSQGLCTGNSRCPRCFSHLQHIPSTCHQCDPLTHCLHQCFHPMSEAEGPSCHGMLEGLRHPEYGEGGWDSTDACPLSVLHLPRGKEWGGSFRGSLLLSSCWLSSLPQQLFSALPHETLWGAVKLHSQSLEWRHGSTTQCWNGASVSPAVK